MNQLQQGDVLFVKVSTLPSNLKAAPTTRRGIILADGETTGHAHTIEDLENVNVFVDESGALYVEAKEATVVTHEEHKPVTLPAGIYKVGRVQEVDPFENEIRSVRD